MNDMQPVDAAITEEPVVAVEGKSKKKIYIAVGALLAVLAGATVLSAVTAHHQSGKADSSSSASDNGPATPARSANEDCTTEVIVAMNTVIASQNNNVLLQAIGEQSPIYRMSWDTRATFQNNSIVSGRSAGSDKAWAEARRECTVQGNPLLTQAQLSDLRDVAPSDGQSWLDEVENYGSGATPAAQQDQLPFGTQEGTSTDTSTDAPAVQQDQSATVQQDQSATSSTDTESSAPVHNAGDASGVLTTFYRHLTRGEYRAAWKMLSKSARSNMGSYSGWVAGYRDSGVQSVTNIEYANGTDLTYRLTSDNPDGSRQQYDMEATVVDGKITHLTGHQVSGS
jgi:hypothetical protein